MPVRGSASRRSRRLRSGMAAMHFSAKISVLVVALVLAGCVVVPTGPSVMVLPGTGKPFDQFRADEGVCRQYAYEQNGGQTASSAQ